eukprot:GDKH01009553.1.p2 GENE.GDKH01009553.1~~GDKH01009553.1.p2  ORF type:complete len:66 (+),score=1.02 GDKH01009553.1:120-317(+)
MSLKKRRRDKRQSFKIIDSLHVIRLEIFTVQNLTVIRTMLIVILAILTHRLKEQFLSSFKIVCLF